VVGREKQEGRWEAGRRDKSARKQSAKKQAFTKQRWGKVYGAGGEGNPGRRNGRRWSNLRVLCYGGRLRSRGTAGKVAACAQVTERSGSVRCFEEGWRQAVHMRQKSQAALPPNEKC